MSWGMIAVAGASLVGGAMASSASKDAADTQAGSSKEATDLQREMFNKQVELQAPFREAGLTAQNRLLYLLGLPQTATGTASGSPVATTAAPAAQQLTRQADGSFAPAPAAASATAPAAIDRNALRAELLGQFTRTTPGSPGQMVYNGENEGSGAMIGYVPPSSSVDEQGLNAAIEQRAQAMQAQQAAQAQQAQQTAQAQQQAISGQIDSLAAPAQASATQTSAAAPVASNPAANLTAPGSLALPFGDQQFQADAAPKIADFSLADFQADPGYAFRQSEQEKALQRAASAGGLLGSGKFLKDAMSYSGGLASQEYGNAFGRFQTNRLNKLGDYKDAFNRFQISRSNVLNPLQSLMGAGQTATGQQAQAAQNFGQQAGNNIMGAGNAIAAGQVGSANAINNGISQGVSAYQQQNMLSRFFPQGTPPPANPYYTG